MDRKETLTNEKLKKRFLSQFELVGYAIKLVENMVKSGRAPRIYTEDQNLALIALDEMNQGRDVLESLPDDTLLIDRIVKAAVTAEPEAAAPPVEKKKPRRII